MEKKPLISIITVNLNNLEGLKKTMKSVLEQTWQEFEYIIIDGGSTDGSEEFIETKKQWLDYWVSEPDNGIYNAMNKGIKVATGEYLLFLNSGDHLFADTVLEENYAKIYQHQIISFDIKVVKEKERYIKKAPTKLSFFYFIKDTLAHQSTFIKAILFEQGRLYDEELKISSDWKFFVLTLCKYNSTYFHVNKILSCHYLDGISAEPGNQKLIEAERKSVLNSEFKYITEDYKNFIENQNRIIALRGSKKLKVLKKLGFINKF